MSETTGAWFEAGMLGFDTETTGIWVKRDRIATASLIWRDQAGNRTENWIINPGIPMPPAASAVNGLTDAFLREHGEQPAVALDEIASALAEEMSRGVPAVGFNVSFDFAILEAELSRYDLPTLSERLGGTIAPVVDPLVLDRIFDRYRRGKRRLAAVCAVYGLPERSDFHQAEADVSATLDLLDAMIQRFDALRQMSIEEVTAFQREGHREWAKGFNEYMKNKRPDFRPVSLEWPLSH